jgi:hypothetical protein
MDTREANCAPYGPQIRDHKTGQQATNIETRHAIIQVNAGFSRVFLLLVTFYYI